MIDQDQVNNLKELLNQAKTILLVFPIDANYDLVASASSLFLVLQTLGKDVTLLSPKPVKDDFASLAGIDQVKQKLGNKNLVVSFDYEESAVDKVSYHIGEETKKFYLTVKPQKGHKPLDSSTVDFSYTGAEADIIILFGIHELEVLDQLYFGYESLYDDATIVTIHKFEPEEIGHIRLDISDSICMSEAMVFLFEDLDLELNPEIATNLLSAIEQITDSFKSFSTTAETFEVVASLMRAGARRMKRKPAKQFKRPQYARKQYQVQSQHEDKQQKSSRKFDKRKQGSKFTGSKKKRRLDNKQQQAKQKTDQSKPGDLKFQPPGGFRT